jgi:hypothetical protein
MSSSNPSSRGGTHQPGMGQAIGRKAVGLTREEREEMLLRSRKRGGHGAIRPESRSIRKYFFNFMKQAGLEHYNHMNKGHVLAFLAVIVLASALTHAQTTAPEHSNAVSPSFLVGQGAAFTATYFDMHLTNKCVSDGVRELNPLLGSHPSPTHVYAFGFGTAAAGAFLSYEVKKHGGKIWMIEPASTTGGHAVGAILNSRCR